MTENNVEALYAGADPGDPQGAEVVLADDRTGAQETIPLRAVKTARLEIEI